MNLKRWVSVILVLGLVLALTPLTVQADPYWRGDHPRGHAYGWERHRGFDRHDRYWRHHWRGPHHRPYMERYYGAPQVAYVTPMAPVVGIPYAQPQPYYQGPRGLSGTLQYNF